MQLGYISLSLHSHRESLRARNGTKPIVQGGNARRTVSTDLLPCGVTMRPGAAHQIGAYDQNTDFQYNCALSARTFKMQNPDTPDCTEITDYGSDLR